MFARFKLTAFLLALILSLGGWSWYQGQKIDSLKAENQAQAQTIIQLELEQQSLHSALEEERQAVKFQQRFANQLKQKTEQARENVKVILQKEPCGVARLPSDVIRRIKQLHSENAN